MTPGKKTFHINREKDVETASYSTLKFCKAVGMSNTNAHFAATAVSELAMNIFKFALPGKIHIHPVCQGRKDGIEIIAEDNGPGILDIEKALQDHYSTSGSLGIGLPGVKRMMDKFDINSAPGCGTRIRAVKWMGK